MPSLASTNPIKPLDQLRDAIRINFYSYFTEKNISCMDIVELSQISLNVFFIYRYTTQNLQNTIPKSYFLTILVGLALIFSVSANLAWLNPRPVFSSTGGDQVKLSEKIPLFWKFNCDSILGLETAQYFPSFYHSVPITINRPVYPIIVHAFGHTVVPGFVQTKLSTAAGYLLQRLSI
jgi:hypothetical protein